MRKEINSIIRNYAQNHENAFEATWNLVYREFNRQNHMYIKARAKHRNMRPLDMVEQLGMMADLWLVTINFLVA